MAKVKPISLAVAEQAALQEIIKKGADWRERDRAETILLLASGSSIQDVAQQQGWCIETVRIRRRKWLKRGLRACRISRVAGHRASWRRNTGSASGGGWTRSH